MLLSILSTLILQEMASRLGFVSQRGLGEALRLQMKKGLGKYFAFSLVIGAIIIGNTAYEAGNISGGILGLQLTVGIFSGWPVVLGSICFLLMYYGGYAWIEKILIMLVLLMSLCFLLTTLIVEPPIFEILNGFIPRMPSNQEFLLVMAVIGTTVVPYNLFLHASLVAGKRTTHSSNLKEIRLENFISITLGGVVSILIIVTAASSADKINEVVSAKDMAIQLEPLFGLTARYLMGIGLMAAGISSAITAPMAAAYAAKGLFGWKGDEKNTNFKITWISILIIGVIVASTNVKDILIIKFAQIANALLLPFIAVFLLRTCNSRIVLGSNRNSILTNILGILVIILTVLISLKSLDGIFNIF